MARIDRLFQILQVLRRLPPPVTAARLAEETGVSERTLYRDIDSLRASGALIDGAPGYGYRLTEDPALPPQSFTRLEIEALVLGLAEVRYRADSAMAQAAEEALAKVVATLPERQARQAIHASVQVFRYMEPRAELRDLSLVRTACWEERALDITYQDARGAFSERRIYPLSMVYLNENIALLAWCCKRRDFRQFLVGRLIDMHLTDESFRPRRVGLLREYVARLRGEAAIYKKDCPCADG